MNLLNIYETTLKKRKRLFDCLCTLLRSKKIAILLILSNRELITLFDSTKLQNL